jgi:hypothetical protein
MSDDYDELLAQAGGSYAVIPDISDVPGIIEKLRRRGVPLTTPEREAAAILLEDLAAAVLAAVATRAEPLFEGTFLALRRLLNEETPERPWPWHVVVYPAVAGSVTPTEENDEPVMADEVGWNYMDDDDD